MTLGVRSRRWKSSLTLALGIGLAFRVAVVALSYRHTPDDAAIVFRHSAELVRAGRNPVFAPEWSSTPLVPYLHAALFPVALPWQVVEKALPVLADLVTIVLVGRLAGHRAATARLLYATNPLALLVVAHHGQLEPVGVALALAAVLVIRRPKGPSGPGVDQDRAGRRALVSGLLLGMSVAVKTWSVVMVPGLLRESARRHWPLILGGLAGPPLALLAAVPVFSNGGFLATARVVASYRSIAGDWGWTGVLHLLGHSGRGYAGPDVDRWQHLGTIVTLAAWVLVVALFHRADGPDLALAPLLAVLAVTAGFGVQYLLWPVALLLARGGWNTWCYLWPAAAYAGYDYLRLIPLGASPHHDLVLQSALSITVCVGAVVALPWSGRRGRPATPAAPPEPHHSGHERPPTAGPQRCVADPPGRQVPAGLTRRPSDAVLDGIGSAPGQRGKPALANGGCSRPGALDREPTTGLGAAPGAARRLAWRHRPRGLPRPTGWPRIPRGRHRAIPVRAGQASAKTRHVGDLIGDEAQGHVAISCIVPMVSHVEEATHRPFGDSCLVV